MLWNFQCVKRVDKHVEQVDGKKAGVKRQNSKKGFEKNEHACSVDTAEGVFVVSDPTAQLNLKLTCLTQKIQSLSKL